jgi:hypothetical protein
MEDRSPTLRRAANEDDGFILASTLFMVLAALAVVMVAVMASIEAQGGTTRDLRSKSALQVAESGVDQALLRYNTYSSQAAPLTGAFPCITADGSRTVPSGGWCPGVTAGSGAGTASYYVQPIYTNGLPSSVEIVSVGNVNGVTRRVDTTATSAAGQQVFVNATVMGLNGITTAGNATVHAQAATNGDYVLTNNSKQCGTSSVGVGHSLVLQQNSLYTSDTDCANSLSATSVGHAPLTLAQASDGDASVNNDDGRITNAVNGTASPADLISGNNNSVTWNPQTRALTINHNGALTLTGTKYSFCSVALQQNSALYITAGQVTTLFFDSPESCQQPSGTVQLTVNQNTRITGSDGLPASVAMIFVGSPALSTRAVLASNTATNSSCVQNFVVYAPLTDIELNSNATYCGAMAGKSVTLDSNAVISSDSSSQGYTLPPTSAHFGVTKFVECSATAASPPDAGC